MAWRVEPLHLADVTYPAGHPRAGEIGPVYAFLLLGSPGPILVDTGLGPAHPLIDEYYRPQRRPIDVALWEHGVGLADVQAILVSHFHFDHIGGGQSFPGVPLYVQRAEWEAAQQPDYTIDEFVHFAGAGYRLLDGDFDLAPGLRLLATPGHTPGHQSVAVDASEGLVVIANQAAETASALDGFAHASGESTSDAAAHSLDRLLALQPSKVLLSHDHAPWLPPSP